jgi:hypothetical protein
VIPDTVEGKALAFERALSDLSDPSWMVRHSSLDSIVGGCSTVSNEVLTAAASAILNLIMDPTLHQRDLRITEKRCLEALGSLGPAAGQAAPVLRQTLEKRRYPESEDEIAFRFSFEFTLIKCLAAISPENAVPMLRQEIEKSWPEGWGTSDSDKRFTLLQLLGTISPEDALAYCSRSLEEGGKGDRNLLAVRAAFALGKVAIPTLEKFCGLFSGWRGESCSVAISRLRNNQKSLNLY